MNKQGFTFDIDCNLNISKDTAEVCLKLVEIFVNTHKGFGVYGVNNEDESVSLYLAEYPEGWMEGIQNGNTRISKD